MKAVVVEDYDRIENITIRDAAKPENGPGAK